MINHLKGVLKGSLALMQYFRFVNWWIRGFVSLMSRTGLKFIYSEKATKFCEISTVDLSYVSSNGQMEISQNFVAFSEYMNFKRKKIGASYAFRDVFLLLSTLG